MDSAPKSLKFWVKRTQSNLSKKKKSEGENENTIDHSIGLQCVSPAVDAYGMGKILELLTHSLKKEKTYADLRSISSVGDLRQSRRSRGLSAQNVFASVVGYGQEDVDIEDVSTKVSDFKELRRATKRCLRTGPESRPSIAAVLGKLRKVYNHVCNANELLASPVGTALAHATVLKEKSSESSGEEFVDADGKEDDAIQ